MKRWSNWTPVIVSNREDRACGGTRVREANGAIPGPAFSALNVTYVDEAGGSSKNTSRALNQKIQRQADLRFTIVVAFALALPILIGVGVYVATTAILRAS
jgi:hypothetical protein